MQQDYCSITVIKYSSLFQFQKKYFDIYFMVYPNLFCGFMAYQPFFQIPHAIAAHALTTVLVKIL